jgi:hypothetical protein
MNSTTAIRVVAFLVALLGAGCLMFGINVLSNIFDSDADSGTATYLTVGGVPALFGVVAV